MSFGDAQRSLTEFPLGEENAPALKFEMSRMRVETGSCGSLGIILKGQFLRNLKGGRQNGPAMRDALTSSKTSSRIFRTCSCAHVGFGRITDFERLPTKPGSRPSPTASDAIRATSASGYEAAHARTVSTFQHDSGDGKVTSGSPVCGPTHGAESCVLDGLPLAKHGDALVKRFGTTPRTFPLSPSRRLTSQTTKSFSGRRFDLNFHVLWNDRKTAEHPPGSSKLSFR